LYRRCAWPTLPPSSQALDALPSSHPAATVIQRLLQRTQLVQLRRPALAVDVLNRDAIATQLPRTQTASAQSETCALTVSARRPFPPAATAIQRPPPKTPHVQRLRRALGAAVFNRAVIVTRLPTTQIACALPETSASIVSASRPCPLAVTVTQRPQTPTPSVRRGSFALAASARPALNPRKVDLVKHLTVLSTPRWSSSSTPPSPSSQTRTPSST